VRFCCTFFEGGELLSELDRGGFEERTSNERSLLLDLQGRFLTSDNGYNDSGKNVL
jgi:hypothetical protein